MNIFEYIAYVNAVRAMANDVTVGVQACLAGVVLLLIAWRLIGSSLNMQMSPPMEVIFWGLMASAILSQYVDIFTGLIHLFDKLYDAIRFQTNLRDYFSRVSVSGESEKPAWYMSITGGIYGLVTTIATYGFAWIATSIVSMFAGVFLALLFVVGPIYVVFAPVTQGKSILTLVKNIVEIGCWKLFCAFSMIVITSMHELNHTNALNVMILDVFLAFASLFSPLIVRSLFNGSVASLASAVTTMATYKALGAIGHAVKTTNRATRSPSYSAKPPPSVSGGEKKPSSLGSMASRVADIFSRTPAQHRLSAGDNKQPWASMTAKSSNEFISKSAKQPPSSLAGKRNQSWSAMKSPVSGGTPKKEDQQRPSAHANKNNPSWTSMKPRDPDVFLRNKQPQCNPQIWGSK